MPNYKIYMFWGKALEPKVCVPSKIIGILYTYLMDCMSLETLSTQNNISIMKIFILMIFFRQEEITSIITCKT